MCDHPCITTHTKTLLTHTHKHNTHTHTNADEDDAYRDAYTGCYDSPAEYPESLPDRYTDVNALSAAAATMPAGDCRGEREYARVDMHTWCMRL